MPRPAWRKLGRENVAKLGEAFGLANIYRKTQGSLLLPPWALLICLTTQETPRKLLDHTDGGTSGANFLALGLRVAGLT